MQMSVACARTGAMAGPTCSECGVSDVQMSVSLLEPLKDKKDGTGGKGGSISDDVQVICASCGHIAFKKLSQVTDWETETF